MAAGASSRTIGRELGTHKKIVPGLGTHIRIVPGLEAFNHVRDVKPGPERSEGPAFKAGRKC
jgi:hypothetical protein